MFCPNCGKENSEAIKFCRFCGGKMEISTQSTETSEKKTKKTKTIIGSAVGILIFVIVFVIAYYLSKEGTSTLLNSTSKQEIINETVRQMKNETVFPKEVDSVTTWSDVVAVQDAIRYTYTLHDADFSQASNELFKNQIAPAACNNEDTRKNLLDKDINLEYSYQVQGSSQTFFTSVSKADCL